MTTRTVQLHSRPSRVSRLGAFAHRIERALVRRREAISRGRRRRSAIRDLRSLSDRELRDIGIERRQIAEVVDGLLAAEARETSALEAGRECGSAEFPYAGTCRA